MHTISKNLCRNWPLAGWASVQRHQHPARPAHRVVGAVVQRTGQLSVAHGVDQLLEKDLGLQAGQVHACPCIYGLAVAGAAGVSAVLDILAAEIRSTLTLMGVAGVADLNPSHLRR
ncbi:alpha-hydroxy-acid oxidizing protein [Mycobacterium syngnathidarum]|uniref:alpha-hydroxy-acid oxidizing protein n=1 Tax=Mycobacterium syngnathidarum TaxID=1908205 RepID=UPI0009FAF4A5